MAEDDKGFVSRWSRLKRTRRVELPPEAETNAATPGPPGSSAGEPAPPGDAEVEALVESLPDIDSLTGESDFTVFLQKGVPEELKQRALRRLWRLNPVFANLDGLNDYDEDFTDAALVVKNLKTLYEVGKGMPAPEKPDPEEAEPEAADEATAEAVEEAAPAEQQAKAAESLDHAPPCAPNAAAPEPPGAEQARPAAAVEKSPPGRAVRRRWGRFDS
ncbi:MAG: DUF3306 domain-containing protein [Kiloniellales bacterium]|nr:DUF3306 domain-containing protein [Kiloniellales bacterium]